VAPDPSRLAAVETGAGPRLVLAHGFTQNAGCWGRFGTRLARTHRLVAVDLPGHGASGPAVGDLPDAGRRLVATGGPAAYLGYSLGGRVCLHAAVAHPDQVRRLVLVSTTAGLRAAEERAARRAVDAAWADELDPPGGGGDAAGRLDRFLDRWLAQPLFATLPTDSAEVAARRRNDPAGLASSLRTGGVGTQEPLWDRLEALTMPVLVVVGAADRRYTDLGRQLVEAVGPTASLAAIAGAGHACHLERPERVAAVVTDFLADG